MREGRQIDLRGPAAELSTAPRAHQSRSLILHNLVETRHAISPLLLLRCRLASTACPPRFFAAAVALSARVNYLSDRQHVIKNSLRGDVGAGSNLAGITTVRSGTGAICAGRQHNHEHTDDEKLPARGMHQCYATASRPPLMLGGTPIGTCIPLSTESSRRMAWRVNASLPCDGSQVEKARATRAYRAAHGATPRKKSKVYSEAFGSAPVLGTFAKRVLWWDSPKS
jgi:hypothetical protein